MKKKILHIIIKSSYDGSAVYAVRLCSHMQEYDNNIVSCFKGNAFGEIIKEGIKCVNLLNTQKISYKYLPLKYWKFFRFIKKRSFDIIHYHQGGVGILLLAYLCRKNAKVIHHLHSGNLIGDNKRQNIFFPHLIILKYLSSRTFQIAVAEHVSNEYSKIIKHTHNLKLIKNCTPFEFRKKKKFNYSLGYIGRITKEKGFPLLITVSEKLKQQYPDLRIILKGDGSQSLLKNFKIEFKNIEFLAPSFNVEQLYDDIDILLFLSTAPESLPLVVLEAASYDVGIITFPLTGVKEILGNDYPFFVDSIDDVFNKIALYYSKNFDINELSLIHKTISNNHNKNEMYAFIKKYYAMILTT